MLGLAFCVEERLLPKPVHEGFDRLMDMGRRALCLGQLRPQVLPSERDDDDDRMNADLDSLAGKMLRKRQKQQAASAQDGDAMKVSEMTVGSTPVGSPQRLALDDGNGSDTPSAGANPQEEPKVEHDTATDAHRLIFFENFFVRCEWRIEGLESLPRMKRALYTRIHSWRVHATSHSPPHATSHSCSRLHNQTRVSLVLSSTWTSTAAARSHSRRCAVYSPSPPSPCPSRSASRRCR